MIHTNKSTDSLPDLGKVIKAFLTQLPDADAYEKSSIVGSFFINGEEVKLQASKNRGLQGLIWNVNILEQ